MGRSISNAKDRSLESSGNGLPDVSGAVCSFFRPISVGIVTSDLVRGIARDRVTFVDTMGVKQPFSSEELALKPEGARSWVWYTIHCLPDLVLNTNDLIQIDGQKYVVMAKSNYSEYGYVEYHVVEKYLSETVG